MAQSCKLDENILFNGRIIRFSMERHMFSDGKERLYEIVHHPGAVGVLAAMPDGRIMLVKQYRPASRQDVLEIAAGLLTPGEDPVDTAVKELREELGIVADAKQLKKMGEFFMSPGISTEKFHLFYLAEAEARQLPDPEEDEILETVIISWKEALEMVERFEIEDAKTLIGITLGYQEWQLAMQMKNEK